MRFESHIHHHPYCLSLFVFHIPSRCATIAICHFQGSLTLPRSGPRAPYAQHLIAACHLHLDSLPWYFLYLCTAIGKSLKPVRNGIGDRRSDCVALSEKQGQGVGDALELCKVVFMSMVKMVR